GWPQVGTSTSAQPWTGLIQVRSSTTTWAGGWVVVVVGDERTVVVAALCGAVPWERGAVEHAVKAAATASRVTTSCLLIRPPLDAPSQPLPTTPGRARWLS